MKKIIILVLLVIIAVLGLIWFLDRGVDNNKTDGSSTSINKNEYSSSEYSFALDYAEDWEEFISDEEISPRFNFYPADTLESELPLDHFVNETHVSVFPEGIPTEGIFAQSVSVEGMGIQFPYELNDDSRVYTLETGEPFAIYIKPTESPDSWNSSGFVFARVKINNLDTRCERGGQIVSRQECDPLASGDQVIWNGDIDTNRLSDLIESIESFEFTSELSNKDVQDDNFAQNESLVVYNPQPDQIIESPLEVEGEVRGTWLFEATAPVILTDWDGRIIAETYIQAEGDWMTEDFVPFSGLIEFEDPEDIGDFSDRGSIIFQKANPSGLPENDDALEFNVLFR